MLIHVESGWDIETGRLLHWVGEEYKGPFALCGGGPSPEQRNAANSQAKLTDTLGGVMNRQEGYFEKAQDATRPFFTNRMNQGLPYYNNMVDSASGITAQAFAPARAQMERSLGSQQGLPNGFAQGARNDFNERQGQAFGGLLLDAQSQNEQAKRFGAAGISGMGQQNLAAFGTSAQGALQGNNSIMQAPLQKPGVAGLIGGLASGAMSFL